MVKALSCIHVYSITNDWIDFVIIPYNDNFAKAKDVIDDAYNDWWDSEEANGDIPISEYIEMKLRENDIEYDIYYSNKEEEEL